jgi:hypothetical protein
MMGRSIFGLCPGTQGSRSSRGTGCIVSRGATWKTGLRWFVRAAAVFVALVNLSLVILWLVGGFYVLGGEDASTLGEAVPSLLLAVIAGLVTSEIVLRVFELLWRGFLYRYQVVVISVCLGGAIEGGMLSLLYATDGTMFPAPVDLRASRRPARHRLLRPAGRVIRRRDRIRNRAGRGPNPGLAPGRCPGDVRGLSGGRRCPG